MNEFFRRLSLYPLLTTEILVATFLIALLALASPLFVIQVLNRYITYGFTGTLITLTLGMVVAMGLQFSFRLIRTKIASHISLRPDANLSASLLNILTRAKSLQFDSIPKPRVHETINGLQTIKSAYNASSINAILDAPFSFIFILATLFLSPILALVSLFGIASSLLVGWLAMKYTNPLTQKLQNLLVAHRGMVFSAANNIDTVRSFRGQEFIKDSWDEQLNAITDLQKKQTSINELSQSVTLTLNVLMSVVLYAVGAVLVVQGKLSVGALIGANILAGRAFSATTKFVQTTHLISKASQSLQDIFNLLKIPQEAASGTAMTHFNGTIELKDLSFAYPGSSGPLFESLNVVVEPGSLMAVTGRNGSGKTTFIRLLAGLIEPNRGVMLADGVGLKHISQDWWRRQIIYMPQEPTFLNGSIRENISMPKPDISTSRLNDILAMTALRDYINKTPKGLETMILNNGLNLPAGIRRRIALARALTTDGILVLMDEPTEGLDLEGCRAVYSLMSQLAQRNKAMLVVSRDQIILKSAQFILDLNHKPTPRIITRKIGGKAN